GVAAMTALLQARIHGNSLSVFDPSAAGLISPSEVLSHRVFAAYTGCFRTMAIITATTLPGILLFRVLRPQAAAPRAAYAATVKRLAWSGFLSVGREMRATVP